VIGWEKEGEAIRRPPCGTAINFDVGASVTFVRESERRFFSASSGPEEKN
jgi:hypothetical protein